MVFCVVWKYVLLFSALIFSEAHAECAGAFVRKNAAQLALDKLILPAGYLLDRGAATAYQEVLSLEGLDVNVLIEGESGSGKEGMAKLLHMNSGRRDQVLVPF